MEAQDAQKLALFQHVLLCLDQPSLHVGVATRGNSRVPMSAMHADGRLSSLSSVEPSCLMRDTASSLDFMRNRQGRFASLSMTTLFEEEDADLLKMQYSLVAGRLAAPPLVEQLSWGVYGSRGRAGRRSSSLGSDLHKGKGGAHNQGPVVGCSDSTAIGNGASKLGFLSGRLAFGGNSPKEKDGDGPPGAGSFSRRRSDPQLAAVSILEAEGSDESLDLRTGSSLVRRCKALAAKLDQAGRRSDKRSIAQPIAQGRIEGVSTPEAETLPFVRREASSRRSSEDLERQSSGSDTSTSGSDWEDFRTSSAGVKGPTFLRRGFQHLELLPVWENDGSRRKQYAWDGSQIVAVDPPDEDEINGRTGDPLKQAWKGFESFLKRAFIPEVCLQK